MTYYSGSKVQTSRRTVYDTGQLCGPGCSILKDTEIPCSSTDGVKDWLVERVSCMGGLCPSKQVCAKPDINECDIGVKEVKNGPFTSVQWDGRAPKIKCLYPSKFMNEIGVIQRYRDKFGETDDYHRMMTDFCATGADSCAVDPKTGAVMKQCSQMFSTGEAGSACRDWLSTRSDSKRDSVYTEYCLRHPTSPECACINRAADKTYARVKQQAPFNDGCWYAPCAGSSGQLVTSDLRDPSCPANLCQVLYTNLENNNVSIKDVKTEINCSFDVDPPAPPPKPPTPPPLPPPAPLPAEPPNAVPWMVIGGLGAVAALSLGTYAMVKTSRR